MGFRGQMPRSLMLSLRGNGITHGTGLCELETVPDSDESGVESGAESERTTEASPSPKGKRARTTRK